MLGDESVSTAILSSLIELQRSPAMYTDPALSAEFFKLLRAVLITLRGTPTASDCLPILLSAVRAHPVLELDDTDEDVILQGLLACVKVLITASLAISRCAASAYVTAMSHTSPQHSFSFVAAAAL